MDERSAKIRTIEEKTKGKRSIYLIERKKVLFSRAEGMHQRDETNGFSEQVFFNYKSGCRRADFMAQSSIRLVGYLFHSPLFFLRFAKKASRWAERGMAGVAPILKGAQDAHFDRTSGRCRRTCRCRSNRSTGTSRGPGSRRGACATSRCRTNLR